MGFIAGAAGQPAQAPDGLTGLGIKAATAPDAATTFLSTMTDVQVANLTAARVYTLPSTDAGTGATVKAGREITIRNRGAFDLTINASGGTTVETIRVGYVRLRALQDAPTTNAHWNVEEVYEEGSYAETVSSAIVGAATCYYRRINKVVALAIVVASPTGSAATATAEITASNVPARLKPVAQVNMLTPCISGGKFNVGIIRMTTAGTCNIWLNNEVNWAATLNNISNNANPSWATYSLV